MQPRSRLDFSGRDRYRLAMAISVRDRTKLIRILKLLGSDQPGERASAALAANRLVEGTGSSWDEILTEKPATKVVVQRVRDWDIDHLDAAEARIRQLKSTTERQERQIRVLRGRINALTERERKRRMAGSDEAVD